jgi:hypothetical protein
MSIELKAGANLLKSNWKTMKLEGKDRLYKLLVDNDQRGYEFLFFDFDEFKMYYSKMNDQQIQELFQV